MRCPKCKSYNHDKANYCVKCGSSLNIEQKENRKKNYVYFSILLILCVSIFLGFFFFIKKTNPIQGPINTVEFKSDPKNHKIKPSKKINFLSDSSQENVHKKQLKGTSKIKLSAREKLFIQAIKLKDADPLKSLVLFVEGYNLNSVLEEDAPTKLRNHDIEENICEIISRLHKMGEDNEVIIILTPEILNKMESINIFKDVLLLITKEIGYGRAIQFAEAVKNQPFFTAPQRQKSINDTILSLYCSWLLQQLNSNNIEDAESIYEFAGDEFPGNAEIELFGVEIALIQGDWEKAELLLERIDIPEALLSRASILKNGISELKGSEGKTIIRFKPGTKHIPLKAELDGKLEQKFLLDTGASFVTVPSSAIKTLKLRIDSSLPTRNVATAGGVKKAQEIVLDSIKLGNCIVHNIKVLILDIPGQPDLGLLGLNFLHLFHVEMDSEKGILTLKPK